MRKGIPEQRDKVEALERLERSGSFYSHPGDSSRHYKMFELYLPAGTVGIVGFQRIAGAGDADISIGTGYRDWNILGEVASDLSTDEMPDILLLPPSFGSGETYYVKVYNAADASGRWLTRYGTIHLGELFIEALAAAAVQTLVECLFTNCSEPSSSEAEQLFGYAVGLGFSAMTRNNICSFGSDAIVGLIANEIRREVNGDPFTSYFLTYALGDYFAEVAYVQCPG